MMPPVPSIERFGGSAMALVDDYILRQIEKIAAFLEALASAPGEDPPPPAILDQIGDVYRSLVGMSPSDVEAMDPETVLRTLHGPAERDALIDLTLAHAEASARLGDHDGARRRFFRAVLYMHEQDPRAERAAAGLDQLDGVES